MRVDLHTDLYNVLYQGLRGKCHNDLAARFAVRDLLREVCSALPTLKYIEWLNIYNHAVRSADEHSTNR